MYTATVYFRYINNAWATFESPCPKEAQAQAEAWIEKEHPNEGAEVHVEKNLPKVLKLECFDENPDMKRSVRQWSDIKW